MKVVIRKIKTDEIVKELDCGDNERKAEKVERGVNINLNHEEYYTEIID